MRRPNKNLPGWAKRLIALRTAQKLSQRQAGERLGLGKGATAQTWMFRLENGREPKSKLLSKLASLYGVSEWFILFGDDAAPLHPTTSIPLLEWGEMSNRKNGKRSLEVPKWLAPIGARSFAIIVPDDLYAPVFMQGDVIFVDPDGKIAVGKHVVVELTPTTYCVCSVFRSGSSVKLRILDKRITTSNKLTLDNVIGVVRRRLQTF